MTSQDPGPPRPGQSTSREEQSSAAIRLSYDLGPLINFFATLPWCLDTLLSEVFSGRAKIRDYEEVPSRFDYFCMIDGHAVTDAEHEEVCRTLLKRLSDIVTWCDEQSVQLTTLINAEVSQGDLLKPQSGPEWRKERSPIFLLEIMHGLASGKSHETVITDLKRYWVRAEVKVTMKRLLPRIIDVFSEKSQMDEAKENVVPESPYQILHRELLFKELGIEYQKLGSRSVVTRHVKVPPPGTDYVELSGKQTAMFEILLYAPGHQCGDEQLIGESGKTSERDRNRKTRDSLIEKLLELGLDIRDCRLVKI